MNPGKEKALKQVSKTRIYGSTPFSQKIKQTEPLAPPVCFKGKSVTIPKAPLGGARKSILNGGSSMKTLPKISVKLPSVVKRANGGQAANMVKSKSIVNQSKQKGSGVLRGKSKSNKTLGLTLVYKSGSNFQQAPSDSSFSAPGNVQPMVLPPPLPSPPLQSATNFQVLSPPQKLPLEIAQQPPAKLPLDEAFQLAQGPLATMPHEQPPDQPHNPPNPPGDLAPLNNFQPAPLQEPLPLIIPQPTEVSGGGGMPLKSNLASMISENFRGDLSSDRVKLKMSEFMGKSISGNTRGSLFVIKKSKARDSTLNLLSATIRDTEKVGKEETEIFIPGKGELRCTLADDTEEQVE